MPPRRKETQVGNNLPNTDFERKFLDIIKSHLIRKYLSSIQKFKQATESFCKNNSSNATI